MSRCRTCRAFEPDEVEMFIVHLWQTHGVSLETMKKEEMPNVDWDRISGLVKEHKITGKQGSGMFAIKRT